MLSERRLKSTPRDRATVDIGLARNPITNRL